MALPPADPGSTCVVTGASSGIGAAFAEALAARGYNVALVARRAERLEALATRLRDAHGVEVDVLPCDLSDAAARVRLLSDLAATGRPVEVLINNAGYGTSGRWLDGDADIEAAMVRLIVDAPMHLCRQLIPPMVERGRGAVINVGSIVSFQPTPGMATYAAAKAFSLSLTSALHAELAGTGVTAMAFCPGPVKTEFTAVAGGEGVADALPGFLWLKPEDVAARALAALEEGKRLLVPGWPTRIAAFIGQRGPRGLMLRVAHQMMLKGPPAGAARGERSL